MSWAKESSVSTDSSLEVFRRGLDLPSEVQARTLIGRILQPNASSEFGRKHAFESIRTIDDFRAAVPVRSYGGFHDWIERTFHGESGVLVAEPVRRFFRTSGTTDTPKHIPVTGSFIRDKARAFGIYWASVVDRLPHITRDRIVTNFSDSGREDHSPGGTPVTSESGFWARITSAARRRAGPPIPEEVLRIPDSETRYYALARLLLDHDFQVLMTLNPSTMLRLFQVAGTHAQLLVQDLAGGGITDQLPVPDIARRSLVDRCARDPQRAGMLAQALERNPDRFPVAVAWPSFELAVCWRSPMLSAYHRLLEPFLEGVAGQDFLLMASEGVMAIPTEPGISGGVLATSIHFLELLPVSEAHSPAPTTVLPEYAETGELYVIVLTTSAGLYRYNIGDVVRVTGFEGRTPTVEFLHRLGRTCSLTGEKLTEEQVSLAVARLLADVGIDVASYTLQPAPDGYPRYVLLLEPVAASPAASLPNFSVMPQRLDLELARANVEYSEKRTSGRLGPPEVWLVGQGEYRRWIERRVVATGSDDQIKPVHLTRDPHFHEHFQIHQRWRHED